MTGKEHTGTPRPSFETYPAWHLEELKEDLSDASLRVWYEIHVRNAKITLQNHAFFSAMTGALQAMSSSGVLSRNQSTSPALLEKSFTSVTDKLFRTNVNWNRSFPKQPSTGWVRCADVFEKMDDLVRTLIVCRYIDGPEQVCQDLIKAASECGLKARASPKATEEGYYAHHFNLEFPLEILDGNGRAKSVHALAEIQVTTQMQDVLRDLTHVYYNKRRLNPGSRKTAAMRWDFKSADFRAEYLGHTLHLIEGIVAELRAESMKSSVAHDVSDAKEAD